MGGPKEMVPFAKMLIKSQVTSIQERQKFIDRQREANNSLNDGYYDQQGQQGGYDNGYYDQGYDQNYDQQGGQGQHWDQYGQAPQMMNNGGGRNQRSPRRQRRQQRQQQQQMQTERSAKDTGDFNYLNNNKRRRNQQPQYPVNDDPHYPQLGSKAVPMDEEQMNGGDSKDVSNDDDQYPHADKQKSWVDMHDDDAHYEQPQRDVRNVEKNSKQTGQKSRWKVKSTPEQNEVDE